MHRMEVVIGRMWQLAVRLYRSVHTETGSKLVGPNRFTKIGFDDLLAFTLLIRNRFKLHMFAHMLSTTETMEPFLVVCALLWAKMMLLHRFRVRPSSAIFSAFRTRAKPVSTHIVR